MTELTDPGPLTEALEIIDAGLGGLSERELVSTAEMTNLLLDVRMLLGGIDLGGVVIDAAVDTAEGAPVVTEAAIGEAPPVS